MAGARARRIQPPQVFLRWESPTIKSARRAPPGRANAAPRALAQLHPHAVDARRYSSRARAAGPATPMQSPRQAWPPPAPSKPPDSPSSPTLKELKASLQLCASPKNGDDKTYSYLTAGVSTPRPPSLIDDLKASGKTLMLLTVLSPLLLILILYHTLADAIAGTLSAIVSLLIPAKKNRDRKSVV